MPASPATRPSDLPDEGQGRSVYRTWQAATWVAGIFALVVGVAMMLGHVGVKAHAVLDSPQLAVLKEQLRLSPANERIKQQVRDLDLQLRRRYFRQLALQNSGVYLLLGGVALFLAAGSQLAQHRKKLPMPQLDLNSDKRAARAANRSRWWVAASGAIIFIGLLALTFSSTTMLPDQPADLQKLIHTTAGGSALAGAGDAASLEELRRNWPRFRGPEGSGVSVFTNAPTNWDSKTGAGIAWKSAISAPGLNSPIVWNNRVFISGGTAAKREVFCYDATTGRLLWQRAIENVPASPKQLAEISEPPGYTAPTMAADGRRVYVVFANGDLAALTLDGSPVWSRNLGAPRNPYGHATSLAIWPGKLIVQFDQGESGPANSRLIAFDPATGRVLWERSRPVPSSWATPIIIEAAGKTQIVTVGQPWVIAYSLVDGNELWRAQLLDGEITASPVFADGLVFVVNPSSKLIALRPDGSGEVTKTHIVWSADDNVPDIASPVSNGDLLFTATSGGLLTCFDGKDGKKVWEKDLGMEVQSSPAIVGDRLFVLSVKGVGVTVEAGRQFKELARSELADEFLASPAFASGRMFLRGSTNLWCLGLKNHE